MAGRKSIKIEEMLQNIRERLLEDMDFDPKQVRRFFVSNIFVRALAHLIVWTSRGAMRAKGTAAGILKVAPIGSGFEHNWTTRGTVDGEWLNIYFPSLASRVDIWIWDEDAHICRLASGVSFDPYIEIPANSFYSFDCVTQTLQIRHATGGINCRYQIVAWY